MTHWQVETRNVAAIRTAVIATTETILAGIQPPEVARDSYFMYVGLNASGGERAEG